LFLAAAFVAAPGNRRLMAAGQFKMKRLSWTGGGRKQDLVSFQRGVDASVALEWHKTHLCNRTVFRNVFVAA